MGDVAPTFASSGTNLLQPIACQERLLSAITSPSWQAVGVVISWAINPVRAYERLHNTLRPFKKTKSHFKRDSSFFESLWNTLAAMDCRWITRYYDCLRRAIPIPTSPSENRAIIEGSGTTDDVVINLPERTIPGPIKPVEVWEKVILSAVIL